MVLGHTDYQIRFNKGSRDSYSCEWQTGRYLDVEPFSLDLSRVLQAGENEIEIT